MKFTQSQIENELKNMVKHVTPTPKTNVLNSETLMSLFASKFKLTFLLFCMVICRLMEYDFTRPNACLVHKVRFICIAMRAMRIQTALLEPPMRSCGNTINFNAFIITV